MGMWWFEDVAWYLVPSKHSINDRNQDPIDKSMHNHVTLQFPFDEVR